MIAILKLGVAGALGLLLAVVAGTAWHEATARGSLAGPGADVILVLGGGLDADLTLHDNTARRVDLAVRLWQAGRAPVIVMSGGVPDGYPGAAADAMAARAVAAGVPQKALRAETRSHSTLQNGIFSRRLMAREDLRTAVLVTDSYHMARSRLSIWWAGIAVVGQESAPMAAGNPREAAVSVIREWLVSGFNILRLCLWHALGLIGWTEDDRLPLMVERGWKAAHPV